MRLRTLVSAKPGLMTQFCHKVNVFHDSRQVTSPLWALFLIGSLGMIVVLTSWTCYENQMN